MIYNEVIDTLRAIMNIFRYNQQEKKIRRKKKDEKAKWYGLPKADKVHEEFGIDNVRSLSNP